MFSCALLLRSTFNWITEPPPKHYDFKTRVIGGSRSPLWFCHDYTRRLLYRRLIGFSRIDTVFVGLLIAQFVDPRRNAFFIVVFELSFLSQLPRVAVHDVSNDCDYEWCCKQPEHAPCEVTANACVHEIEWNAKQADDRDEANQI